MISCPGNPLFFGESIGGSASYPFSWLVDTSFLLGKRSVRPSFKLVLIRLMAMPAGRFIEQMVGVARVSDLTIFWALLAVFAAMPEAMQATTDETAPESRPRQSRELSAWHTPRVTKGLSAGWQTLFGLAVVACLVFGVVWLTWVKTVNYPHAALITHGAAAQFRQGKLADALASIDRAIDLAPEVSTNYRLRDQMNSLSSDVIHEKNCSFHRFSATYEACRAEQNYLQSIEWVDQQPFSLSGPDSPWRLMHLSWEG